jgi:hypothetical protein
MGAVTMGEYGDLLVEAYRGELLGAAFFSRLAERCDDGSRREKLLVLARVESHTASQLRPLVDAAGIEIDDAEAAARDGRELAGASAAQTWPVLLEGLRSALPAFLDKFLRLQAVAQDPDDPVLADLVAHEQAIDRFAAEELEGHGDESLTVLHAHLARAGATAVG